MTPEAQRLAIAEVHGWIDTGNSWKGYHCWTHPDGTASYGQKEDRFSCVPNYPNDLNAIREAVLEQGTTFAVSVSWLLQKRAVEKAIPWTLLTAEDWSEAFLRTIGKWTEDPNP